jgi:hypothetical protein
MITEKGTIARNSQANANDCNEESRAGDLNSVFDMEPV